jgi:hypothetical protein
VASRGEGARGIEMVSRRWVVTHSASQLRQEGLNQQPAYAPPGGRETTHLCSRSLSEMSRHHLGGPASRLAVKSVAWEAESDPLCLSTSHLGTLEHRPPRWRIKSLPRFNWHCDVTRGPSSFERGEKWNAEASGSL